MNHRRAGRRQAVRPRRTPRADALTWPEDLSGRCARLTAIGNRRLLVENHKGILELTDACVRLDTGRGAITICGRDLSLCDARRDSVIIRGRIDRVDLPEGGPDE